jgi:hypothetical protein
MGLGLIKVLKSSGIEFSHEEHRSVGFHGTSQIIADRISATGFNMDLADPQCWLGKAVYFFDNARFAGSQYALCYAINTAKFVEPAVIEADLFFKSLLDLTRSKNESLFWKLHKLLKQTAANPDDIDEHYVNYFIGTDVAEEMDSDGVAMSFPMSEPLPKRSPKHKRQRGFAVKKLAVINRVNRYKFDGGK